MPALLVIWLPRALSQMPKQPNPSRPLRQSPKTSRTALSSTACAVRAQRVCISVRNQLADPALAVYFTYSVFSPLAWPLVCQTESNRRMPISGAGEAPPLSPPPDFREDLEAPAKNTPKHFGTSSERGANSWQLGSFQLELLTPAKMQGQT